MTRMLAALCLMTAAPLALTACEQTNAPAEAQQEISSSEVANARLVMPPVSGNPGAVYLDFTNTGDDAVTIEGGEIAGVGRTEFHLSQMTDGAMVMGKADAQTVQPGDTLSLKPGSFHMMVFEIGDGVAAGGTVEGALLGANGERFGFTADIQSASEAR